MTRAVQLSRCVAVVAVVSLCGCASRDQFLQLRRDLNQVRRVLADTQSDVQAQQRQIQALAGQSDTLRRDTGFGGVPSVEDRVAALEARNSGGGTGELTGTPGLDGTPGVDGAVGLDGMLGTEAPAPPTGGVVAGEELAALQGTKPGEDEYRMALALVEQKNCDEAVPRLRSYLRKHPDTGLSDNAQYWIGECYYAQRDFNNAILAFYDVTRRYPKGDKVCAAMLKQGFAFAELGDAADARIVLERLIQTHPDCDEVSRARAKLSGLRQG
jgi:tol-pal system protein YbgF